MTPTRRTVVLGTVAAALSGAVPSSASAAAEFPPRLSNLAHLDFLRASVTPPPAPGHATYGSAPLGVLWTYADNQADGSYKRIGGGTYDAATTPRSGCVQRRRHRAGGRGLSAALDAVPRAASLAAARDLLRALTFLQSPNGNVVLWMQPDGTLNPSAEPVELPDPSDSGPSYWLARTVWALGEGYAASSAAGTELSPAFLRDRLERAIAALEREVLVRYGQYNVVDGRRLPAWLIVDGADATSEAVLGLAAYVRSGGSAGARRALTRFAEGIARMSAGSTREWPFRALLPWGQSISDWHAWGAQMSSALAAASAALGSAELLTPAIGDTAGFTPLLLTSGGPDNGWLPTPIDRSQIAYGVDARLQGLLAVDRPGLRHLAAFTAAWYFGANRAGRPMYDPATGRTYDGISGDGVVNSNSGAESTIHGQLSMLALDAHRDVARLTGQTSHDGLQIIEAESVTGGTGGTVVTPPSAWTGESQWSNGAYLSLDTTASWTVPGSAQPRLVLPVVNLLDTPTPAHTTWTSGTYSLGTLTHACGPQGTSAAPGALQPLTLEHSLPADATTLTARATGTAQLDALLLLPTVSSLRVGTATLLVSVDTVPRVVGVSGKQVFTYDCGGELVARGDRALVVPGGFTVVLGAA